MYHAARGLYSYATSKVNATCSSGHGTGAAKRQLSVTRQECGCQKRPSNPRYKTRWLGHEGEDKEL